MFVNIRDSSLSPISYVSDMNLRVIHNAAVTKNWADTYVSDMNLRVIHNVIISDEGTVKYVSDINLRIIHNIIENASILYTMFLI